MKDSIITEELREYCGSQYLLIHSTRETILNNYKILHEILCEIQVPTSGINILNIECDGELITSLLEELETSSNRIEKWTNLHQAIKIKRKTAV